MRRFILILTAITLTLTFCACSLVETEPEDIETTDDIIVSDGSTVEEPEFESVEEDEAEAEVIGIVDGEKIYDGESPFSVNFFDPDNISENAIYVETAEIPEEVIEYVTDQLEHMSVDVIASLGYAEFIVEGMSVATGITPYNGSTGEYYDTFYYFPIMYGDEVVSMAICSYDGDSDSYGFQFGSCYEATTMNYLKTSVENPAMLVYFDDSLGGYFVTTTTVWKFSEISNSMRELSEDEIPDSLKEIMNREVNSDNVVAIYGAEMEELIDD
ncbi:MAG: hypothetical protein LUH18_10180 [Oscillospiraceae bacterium]|nr:hypothetical protein [Oscillospiraceae bacterium]